MAYQYAPIGPAGGQQGALVQEPKLQAGPKLQTGTPIVQRDEDEDGFEGLARGLLAAPLARLLLDKGISKIPFLKGKLYEDPLTGEPIDDLATKETPSSSVFTEDTLKGLTGPQQQALLDAEARVRALYQDKVKKPRQLTRSGETVQGILQLLSSIGLKGDDVSTFASTLNTASKLAGQRDISEVNRYLTQQQKIAEKTLSSMPNFTQTNVFGAYLPVSAKQREEADKDLPAGKRPKFTDSPDAYQLDRQALVNANTGVVHLMSLGKDADRDENNKLVAAGKYYENINFTAAAEKGERKTPTDFLLQNQLTGDIRQGTYEFYDKDGDGTEDPVFKVEEVVEGGLKYVPLGDLDKDPAARNYLPEGHSAWIKMDGEVFEKQPRPKQTVVSGITDYLDDVNARDAAIKKMLTITNQLENVDKGAYASTTATIANLANNIKEEVLQLGRFFGTTGKEGMTELHSFNTRNFSVDAMAAQKLSAANLQFINKPTKANKENMIDALAAFQKVAKRQKPSQGMFDADSWVNTLEMDGLKNLSIDRAVLLSSQIQLGYLSATLFGQSGKNLSDADFAYNLQLMGFEKSKDKDVILGNLNNYLAKELYMMDQEVVAQPYLSGSPEDKDIAVAGLFRGTLGVNPNDLEVISRPRPVGENNTQLPDRDPAVLAWKDNIRKARTNVQIQLHKYTGGKGFTRMFRYDPNARGPGIGGYKMSNATERLGNGNSGYQIIDSFIAPGGLFDRYGKMTFGKDWDWRIQGGASQNQNRQLSDPRNRLELNLIENQLIK